jgi:hypothetical protein
MLLKRGSGSFGPSFFFGSGPATLHVNDRPELRCEQPVATHVYLMQIRQKLSSDRKDYLTAFSHQDMCFCGFFPLPSIGNTSAQARPRVNLEPDHRVCEIRRLRQAI